MKNLFYLCEATACGSQSIWGLSGLLINWNERLAFSVIGAAGCLLICLYVTFKEQCLMWIEYAGIMAIVSRLQSEEPVWSHRTVNSAADSTTTAVHSGNLGLMVGEVLNWEQISGASFSSTGGPKCLIANWVLVVMKASLQTHYAQQTNKEL